MKISKVVGFLSLIGILGGCASTPSRQEIAADAAYKAIPKSELSIEERKSLTQIAGTFAPGVSVAGMVGAATGIKAHDAAGDRFAASMRVAPSNSSGDTLINAYIDASKRPAYFAYIDLDGHNQSMSDAKAFTVGLINSQIKALEANGYTAECKMLCSAEEGAEKLKYYNELSQKLFFGDRDVVYKISGGKATKEMSLRIHFKVAPHKDILSGEVSWGGFTVWLTDNDDQQISLADPAARDVLRALSDVEGRLAFAENYPQQNSQFLSYKGVLYTWDDVKEADFVKYKFD